MNCLFYFGILPAVNSPVSSLIPPWTDHSLYFYPVATTQLFSLHQNPPAANRLATAGPSVLFVLSGCEVTNVLDSSGRLSTSQSVAAVNHQPVSLQSLAEKRSVSSEKLSGSKPAGVLKTSGADPRRGILQ